MTAGGAAVRADDPDGRRTVRPRGRRTRRGRRNGRTHACRIRQRAGASGADAKRPARNGGDAVINGGGPAGDDEGIGGDDESCVALAAASGGIAGQAGDARGKKVGAEDHEGRDSVAAGRALEYVKLRMPPRALNCVAGRLCQTPPGSASDTDALQFRSRWRCWRRLISLAVGAFVSNAVALLGNVAGRLCQTPPGPDWRLTQTPYREPLQIPYDLPTIWRPRN